jgi:uncharacterized protein YkwD
MGQARIARSFVLAALAWTLLVGTRTEAEPRVAGTVVVNGKSLANARFYRDGKHLLYPLLAIAQALGHSVAYDPAERQVRLHGRSVPASVVLIENAPYVSWRTLSAILPDVQYGVRGDTAYFDSRPTVATPPSSAPPPGTDRIRGSAGLSSLEAEIVGELNLARTAPLKYVSHLEAFRRLFQGDLVVMPDGTRIQTREGVAAVDEAIRCLQTQAPVGPVEASAGLTRGARDHVKDTGPRGVMDHSGSDGSHPSDRVNRYGKWRQTMGENIAFGVTGARNIVIQLIVDDGVSDRGHRKNIFQPAFRCVGVACGPHAKFGFMCVMDFAGGFDEKR